MMGYNERWIEWIKQCVETTSFSILINVSSTSFFRSSNGIRQGDPLSLLSFTIAMEGLSCLLDDSENKGEFFTFSVGCNKVVSHLIFADDVLIYLKPRGNPSQESTKC